MFIVGLGKDLIYNLEWTNIVGGLSTHYEWAYSNNN
jgi:hypothetical protein